MRNSLLFSLLFLPVMVFAQVSVSGKVSAGDSIQISISSVAPSDFPLIEVLFRAENLDKYPYWGLEKEDLKVFENEVACEVISLRHFSESEPINISIVIDHSGSMSGSYSDYLDYYNNDSTKIMEAFINGDLPDIKNPLDNAVSAVKGFLANFENEKDYIGVYAFDDTVDVQIKPTNNITELIPVLDSLEPTGSTAFFDAVFLATEGLADLEGINVVIALTDGQDNASEKQARDITRLAKENEIPIYCIGLGDVMPDSLQFLADSTNGYYAYTKKSSALDSIYDLLNRKILAYYLMSYESSNWSSLDADRDVTIEFNQSDTYINDNSLQFALPDEVIEYLKEKEDRERREFQYLVGGVIGGTVLILGLTIFVLRRKRSKKMAITKLYPNPGNGKFTVDIELGSNSTADLVVRDLKGTIVYTESSAQNGAIDVDLTSLPKGYYIIKLQANQEVSASKKYVKL